MIVLIYLFLLLLFLFYLIFYIINKKKEKKIIENIPKEEIELLNKIEELLKGGIENDGERRDPYEILYTAIRERRGVVGGDDKNESRKLSSIVVGRETIQNGVDSSTDEDTISNKQSFRDNIKNFVLRARKRIWRR